MLILHLEFSKNSFNYNVIWRLGVKGSHDSFWSKSSSAGFENGFK